MQQSIKEQNNHNYWFASQIFTQLSTQHWQLNSHSRPWLTSRHPQSSEETSSHPGLAEPSSMDPAGAQRDRLTAGRKVSHRGQCTNWVFTVLSPILPAFVVYRKEFWLKVQWEKIFNRRLEARIWGVKRDTCEGVGLEQAEGQARHSQRNNHSSWCGRRHVKSVGGKYWVVNLWEKWRRVEIIIERSRGVSWPRITYYKGSAWELMVSLRF